MALYWRGRLRFGDPDGLLERFFEKAGDSLRAYAVAYVGRSLKEFREIPAEVLDRTRALWDLRLKAAQAAQRADRFKEELGAFGWWFDSGKFEDGWALKQLLEVLRLAKVVDSSDRVAERLAVTVSTKPLESVLGLKGLVEADEEGWELPAWRDEARSILSHALYGDSQEARRAAADLVHFLGARGHLEFRDLLPK